MLMRARFVFEKFTEDSDPITDMGIGIAKRYKISLSEYDKDFSFHRIEYFKQFNKIFNSYLDPSNSLENLTALTKDNREFMRRYFGKEDFIWTYTRKYAYAWGFEFPLGILIIFTGKRGTSYEYSGNPTQEDANMFKRLLEFIIKNQ